VSIGKDLVEIGARTSGRGTIAIELYSPPPLALVRMERVGRRTIGSIAEAFIAVVLISAIALLWNSYSGGGLLRVLGGVTSQELFEELAAHPGPPGPPGPQGATFPPAMDAPPSATVTVARLVAHATETYDKSGIVEASGAYPVCALSKATVRRDGKNLDGSCQVKRATQSGGQWEVVVNGAICGVTCFSLSTTK